MAPKNRQTRMAKRTNQDSISSIEDINNFTEKKKLKIVENSSENESDASSEFEVLII